MLIFQRYGRGKTFAFLPQDSWVWQMHSTIAVDDLTHENYWRQLLRWLVDGVPDQVEPALTTERVEPGEARHAHREHRRSVVRRAERRRGDGDGHRRPTAPSRTCRCRGTASTPASTTATIPTKAPGWYEAKIDATRAGKSVGSAVTHFRAAPGDAEYFDATMHAGTLRRIAEETGGRFYEAVEHRVARRRSALHRPRRHHRRRARVVAHADRADAARRLAVRGMGVSACRRPGVSALAAGLVTACRVGLSRRSLAQPEPWRRRTPHPGEPKRRIRRALCRSRASATAPPSTCAGGRFPPRADLGARLPARRLSFPEDPRRAHVRAVVRRSGQHPDARRSGSGEVSRSPTCRSPASGP